MSVIIMGFMILLMLGFPIAFVMLAVTIFGSQFIMGTNPTAIIQQAFSGLNSYTILAVPFFIISGSIASNGGTARSLVNVMRKAFGRLPGGLGIAAIMASAFFAAITGTTLATIVANYCQSKDLAVEGGMAVKEAPDYDQVPEADVAGVGYCFEAGIMTGNEAGALVPAGQLTRAEWAQVLVNLEAFTTESAPAKAA